MKVKEEQRPPIPPKPPLGMRLKKTLKFGLGIVILVVVVAAAAFFCGVNQGEETSEPVITSDLLGQSLRSVQELVSVSYYYTNMARYEDQIDFYGWSVPFTNKSFIVSYDGVIKAGVDLSAVDVNVDEGKKSVTVKLPESKVIAHEIKEDSLEVFDEKDNIFNRISIEDYNGFTADQKAAMEERAAGNGLLTEANKNARETVESLLKLTPGMEEYTLRVE